MSPPEPYETEAEHDWRDATEHAITFYAVVGTVAWVGLHVACWGLG